MEPETERSIIDLMGKRFVARGDKHAEQNAKGAYAPVDHAFTRAELSAHLRGEKSFGHYLIGPDDDCVKLVAFDLDLRKELHTTEIASGVKPAMVGGEEGNPPHVCDNPRAVLSDKSHRDYQDIVIQLRMLAFQLSHRLRATAAEMEYPVTVATAFSGSKGIHVYGWFDKRTKADIAVMVGGVTLASFREQHLVFEPVRGSSTYRNDLAFGAVDIEIYPKQGSLEGKTHGNLMRLPLGRNLKTGGRSFFLRDLQFDGDEFEFVETDPLEALEHGTI
jgi:hypothetical protein